MTSPSSVNGKKRRDITDFFLPVSKRSATPATVTTYAQGNPTPVITAVPGLSILDNFITPSEEEAILYFLNDASKCTWRTDLSRRTMHFGGTYCLMPAKSNSAKTVKAEVLQAPPMPTELNWLLDRFETRGIFRPDQRPQYCIVNEYVHAQGISAHVENYSFGEPVVGLSLLCSVDMRFLELKGRDGGSVRSGKAAMAGKTGRTSVVRLKGRGLCIMRRESRWNWQHEIPRSGKRREIGWKRVSLTFRFKQSG
jgi:alkylated DNA repair dioxygenase AlkB